MKIANLYEFVDRAVKNRNYPPNTAAGLKAALKRFEEQANEVEKASIETFREHLDQIYREVVTKNKNFTADSLAVYKSRVIKLLSDYQKYGVDPTKMASWPVKTTPRHPKNDRHTQRHAKSHSSQENEIEMMLGTQKIEHPIRSGAKVVIFLPSDVTKTDIEKIKKLLDLVETK